MLHIEEFGTAIAVFKAYGVEFDEEKAKIIMERLKEETKSMMKDDFEKQMENLDEIGWEYVVKAAMDMKKERIKFISKITEGI